MDSEGYAPSRKSKFPGWAWIVLPILLCLPCLAILGAILFPVLTQARQAALVTVALNETKLATLGALMYAGDHDEIGPASAKWEPLIAPYRSAEVRTSFNGILTSRKAGRTAMNSKAGHAEITKIEDPGKTVFFFLSDMSESSAVGGKENLGLLPRDRVIVGLIDGSTFRKEKAEAEQFRWEIRRTRR